MASLEKIVSLHPPDRYYTRQKLWLLFLTTAFPIHVWTIIRILEDFSWVAERTQTWDAIGAGAYGLVYALVESVLLFLVVALLGFLLPRRQPENKRMVLLSILYLGAALWAMAVQLYSLRGASPSPALAHFLLQTGHPLWALYAAALLLIGLTVLLPAFLVYRSERAVSAILNIIDRLSVLVTMYLVVDVAAILIVIGRNL